MTVLELDEWMRRWSISRIKAEFTKANGECICFLTARHEYGTVLHGTGANILDAFNALNAKVESQPHGH